MACSQAARDRVVARGTVDSELVRQGAKPSASTVRDGADLLARLRAGDERAFASIVERYYPAMIALARSYVRTHEVAEDVVQETWLSVMKSLDRFEERSSLKTWIFRILVNIAITRGTREARSMPVSALAPADDAQPAVDVERFRPADDPYPGHWQSFPADWQALPEAARIGRETLATVKRAVEELPNAQRIVITMRDIAGCTADEVCNALDLSAVNQRVLLHRARSHVRAALERHLDG
jgi:RNA polymerase sigma-70 factor, ECF subfamily